MKLFEHPWAFLADSLYTSAMVYFGMRVERWQQKRRERANWTVTRRRAQHAWDGWTQADVDAELKAAKDLADEHKD